MSEKENLSAMMTDLWHLIRDYVIGSETTDDQWNEFIIQQKKSFNKYAAVNDNLGQLWRELFTAICKYSERKEHEK